MEANNDEGYLLTGLTIEVSGLSPRALKNPFGPGVKTTKTDIFWVQNAIHLKSGNLLIKVCDTDGNQLFCTTACIEG